MKFVMKDNVEKIMNEKELKILVVGADNFPIYETAIYNAFLELGYINTQLFTWKKFLKNKPFGIVSEFSAKAQNKFQFGPRIDRINNALVEQCKSFQPDLVFIYTGILIYAKTIRKIKSETNALVFSYNNDDPFAEYYPKYHWRHYKAAIKECDYNFVYRQKNCTDIKKICDIPVEILRSYYIESDNHPIQEHEKIGNVPEVIFLGHYEPDERSEYMNGLLEEGIQVGVPEEYFKNFYRDNHKIVSIKNNRVCYNEYLCSCKIPLIFLSKINHDTYTRRCFEIPAAGALIFAPYNEDLASMFEENKEAVYYRNKEEFVKKVQYYLQHDEERRIIAEAGRNRLLQDGHEVKDRAKRIIDVYQTYRI